MSVRRYIIPNGEWMMKGVLALLVLALWPAVGWGQTAPHVPFRSNIYSCMRQAEAQDASLPCDSVTSLGTEVESVPGAPSGMWTPTQDTSKCLTLTFSPGSHINDIGNLAGYEVTLSSSKDGGVMVEVCGR